MHVYYTCSAFFFVFFFFFFSSISSISSPGLFSPTGSVDWIQAQLGPNHLCTVNRFLEFWSFIYCFFPWVFYYLILPTFFFIFLFWSFKTVSRDVSI
jgi:hypothetical protein